MTYIHLSLLLGVRFLNKELILNYLFEFLESNRTSGTYKDSRDGEPGISTGSGDSWIEK